MLNFIWIFHYQFNEWLNRRLPFEKNVRWRIVIQFLGGWSMVKTIFLVAATSLLRYFLPPVLTLMNKFTIIIIALMIFLVNTIICLRLHCQPFTETLAGKLPANGSTGKRKSTGATG